MDFIFNIEGGDFTNAGFASSEVKKILKKLNVDPKITRRVVVALYEAEVNVVAHAYRGVIHVDIDTDHIGIVLDDEGPGISSIEQAMQEGFSTASPKVREMGFGAGMGLPNISKNADVLNITSEVGKGTKVEIITYLKPQ
ncbi:MAG TPA: anti-sigma regulatory factor [Marinilabiliales bacterium]|nr:MAG: anti-sigma regulatory factor [Bacteroidetes bacterium GWA2_40_14]OFX60826.1 MAG: anti-sigma regulatory factor [Bacteroidetes bacterium GWC2_40_13]OFX71444.1 MAG: anti-sigma regulatory factor [Bacteroidetes bacterium GWD2_40_43]OFX92693.1 MAG: anti-sigma regulatory factor [Bacteroidetes bacterium GWE2_40_63]OFY17598.1 MAG: anti-sigma regulatory factor [Bacteroidetes bacterium GWF2_40_13]OFZ28051.1 MAG: anti-sigma regulatory factor [Bacteroidetes bacterium RIFOXYC2_FULL_40_12]HAM99647.1